MVLKVMYEEPEVKLEITYSHFHVTGYYLRMETLYQNDEIVYSKETTISFRDMLSEESLHKHVEEDETINMWLFAHKLPILLKTTPITYYEDFDVIQVVPSDSDDYHRICGPDYSYDEHTTTSNGELREIFVFEHATSHLRSLLPKSMGRQLRNQIYSFHTFGVYSATRPWQVYYIQYTIYTDMQVPSYLVKEIVFVHPDAPHWKIEFTYLKNTYSQYQPLHVNVYCKEEIVKKGTLMIHTNNILNYARCERTSLMDEINALLYKNHLPVLLKSTTIADLTEGTDFIHDEIPFAAYNMIGKLQQRRNGVQKEEVFTNSIYMLLNVFQDSMGKESENAYYASMFEYVMQKHPMMIRKNTNIDEVLPFVNPFLWVKK